MNKRTGIKNDETFAPIHELKMGDLELTYESGKIRYIRFRGYEVLRTIYPALRDEQWNTIPMAIHDETITHSETGFSVTYHATWNTETISYQADIMIEGTPAGKVVFEMKGEAGSKFISKRIGLCVLHPIPSCQGRSAEIIHPDGLKDQISFPERISPLNPFTDITAMNWISADQIKGTLKFEGALFETEDQRNWTDDSYKTYSGPQSRVPLIEVLPGDQLHQKVTLDCSTDRPAFKNKKEKKLFRGEAPALGFRAGTGQLEHPGIASLLGALPKEHLQLEVDVRKNAVEKTARASALCDELKMQLDLHLLFHDFSESEQLVAAEICRQAGTPLRSVLILSANASVPPEAGYREVYRYLKENFPQLLTGYGSSSWFANVNAQMPSLLPCDFVGFKINPQTHQTDHHTILENVLSLHSIPESIKAKTGDKPLHISVEFSKENDPRRHTAFAAWYTLNVIARLSGVKVLHLYDLEGPSGILTGEAETPLIKILKEIGPEPLTETELLWEETQHPLETIRSSGIRLYRNNEVKEYFLTGI